MFGGVGLRIAPPEADATGYMFGKGVYFADCFQKSISMFQHSIEALDVLVLIRDDDCIDYARTGEENMYGRRSRHGGYGYGYGSGYGQSSYGGSDSQTQLLLLCEVALGNMWELYEVRD
jgi:hypothetical protein